MIPIEPARPSRVAAWKRASWVFGCVASILAAQFSPQSLQAYTPDSPEVRAIMARGAAYLLLNNINGQSEQLGGECLVGLALYKYNRRCGDQPNAIPAMTQAALVRAVNSAQNAAAFDNYSVGIALITLTEIHPQEHMAAIDAYAYELLRRQKAHGGWGYADKPTGDLSQLQYAVLGMWSARNAGVEVPDRAMADVMAYIMRVQDPTGGWGYQGVDPGSYARVAQRDVRDSLSAAGLGSLYVGADFLRMSKQGQPRKQSKLKLPPALIPVIEREVGPKVTPSNLVDKGQLKQATNSGHQWFRSRDGLAIDRYQFYFIYGYERLQSFKEKVEGTYEEEPRWYNEGVRVLRDTQNDNGSWSKTHVASQVPKGVTPPIATAFSMLFLLRSTRETIEKVVEREGLLAGGYGLPSDLTEIRVRNNKIVAPAITGDVADLITMLEDEEGEKIENMLENPEALSLSGMAGSGREFRARLARILRTGQAYKARMVAARSLGRQGDLDNVPVLIYALTDPDPRVMFEARDGLRLISRKFDGFDLPKKPTPAQLRTVVNQWKAWYKSIRPDAIFIE